MFPRIYPDFKTITARLADFMYDRGHETTSEKWQGMKEPPTFLELLNISFQVPLEEWGTLTPNMPWAEVHYKERVGGLPLNPGESYLEWPFYGQDAKMRNQVGDRFSHTYMERFWPKYAACHADPFMKRLPEPQTISLSDSSICNTGLRYQLGDLQDVINLLKEQPKTRQAYLPIFFPEDTGAVHGGRIPCSIGYNFIRRNGHFHCVYQLRSCDFFRHFQDDLWLACRLTLDILQLLKNEQVPGWADIAPGFLTTHITSLHIFAQEKARLKNYE